MLRAPTERPTASSNPSAPRRRILSNPRCYRLLIVDSTPECFLHAAVIRIEGASYRLRLHADLIPEHVHANAPIMPPPSKKRGYPKKETRTDD